MGIADRFEDMRRLLPGAPRQQPDDERLMQLYWNRVELKKEFTRLQEENYGLLQTIKKYEAEQKRVQERMSELEGFLGNPANGPTALLYFRLRSLWLLACKRIAELTAELAAQQYERERRKQLIEFDQQKQHQLAEVEGRLLDVQSQADALEARVHLLNRKIDELRWFWQYFRRRELKATQLPLREQLKEVLPEMHALQAQRDAVLSSMAPAFPGLSVAGKRLVNTAALAYGQRLLELFAVERIAVHAKETTLRQVQDVGYGAPADCARLAVQMESLMPLLSDKVRDMQGLKATTLKLRQRAEYRSEHDTVPQPESIGGVAMEAEGADGGGREEVNVLLDDYWDLYSVLQH